MLYAGYIKAKAPDENDVRSHSSSTIEEKMEYDHYRSWNLEFYVQPNCHWNM